MYKSKKIKAILLLICFSTITANEPTSPDFSGYTAVGNNQIVNKFSGSLNYSIPVLVVPGPDGSDYQIALSYSSGVQPDQQASWVGYGWSLSPGAITRQKKGFPDDYNNQKIKFWQKFRPSLTASKNVMVRGELMSQDEVKPPLDNPLAPAPQPTKFEDVFPLGESIGLSTNYSRSTTLNNYNGYSVQTTLGIGAGAFGSLSATWNQKGIPTYFYDLNIVALLRAIIPSSDETSTGNKKKSFSEKSLNRLQNQAIGIASANFSSRAIYNSIANNGGGSFPSSTSEFTGSQSTFAPTFGVSLGFLKVEGEPGLTITKIEQKPLDEQPLIKNSFGYMNSDKAIDKKDVMDYYTEKQFDFSKDSKFLPIPFSNADNFYVTCKDLGGSFRAWSRYVEEYRPNEVKSESKSNNFGLSLLVGPLDASVNFGMNYGDGGSSSITREWMSNDYNNKRNEDYSQNSIPKYYFRFHNDLGQNKSFYSNNISNGDSHLPEALRVVNPSTNPFTNSKLSRPINKGSVNFNNEVQGSHNSILNQSKNINFNTNKDLFYDKQNIRKFNKNSGHLSGVNDDIITEFKITNEDGKNFVFGLPVFSRNERSLSYGISKISKSEDETKAYTLDGKIVYHHITPKYDQNLPGNDEPKVILGQEMEEPYVGSFLITEILSNNYIDVNNDGPSIDDIGGYTVFDYEQVYGSDNKKEGIDYEWDSLGNSEQNSSNWYKWRTPVAGYNYDRNSQSDRGDDLISFASGEKEVYNLEAISTKSHVAIFVNNKSDILINHDGVNISIQGSGDDRKDGYESIHSEWVAGKSQTADITSNKNIRYLERIELWKLDEMNPFTTDVNGNKVYNVIKKLQTTFFSYDYSAWIGIPSSEQGSGKLTLKKVWTESGDLKSDYHNPYSFEYVSNYTSFPVYADISNPNPTYVENPNYNILNIDAWGNYRTDNISSIIKGRYFQEQNWVYQNKDTYIGNGYDPSAWNLKQIHLPSSGKIFIDYEENEYTRVQNENPLTLVSIADDGYDENNHKIKLNIENDLGLNSNDISIINDIVNLIEEKYVTGDEKIYFKFLYSLVGPEVYNDITNCASEYIDGFIKLASVTRDDNDIIITFENSEGVFLPRQICKDFFYSNRYGLYDPDLNQDPPCCKTKMNENNEIDYTEHEIDYYTSQLGAMISGSNSFTTFEDQICKSVNLDLSYIRIPLPETFSKRGGGIRVKRVLYLDEFDTKTGEDNATSRAYGNEYVYDNEDRTSSGVASNEPQSLLVENPFYKPIVKRNSSSVYSAGNQVTNILGPFGASIMPSASVGYSRVLSKSIFDNENHPGFTIDSFLTYKDYPFYGVLSTGTDFNTMFASSNNTKNNKKDLKGFSWTSLNDPLRKYIKEPGITFPAPYASLSSIAQASQGFQFITHNYNGKLASTITYGGRYNDSLTWNIGSSTKYEYFGIGEKIPVIDGGFKLRNTNIGRDEEIVMEGRQSENITSEWKAEGDISFILSFPPLITEAGGFGGYNTFSKVLGTHTTNKIINYPAIAKKITTFADGVTTVKEHKAFDIYTGQPFITSINDKYSHADRNDSYYQVLDIPTSYVYDEFSQKSQGLSSTFIGNFKMTGELWRRVREINGNKVFFINMDSKPYGSYSYEFNKYFNVGDIIEVTPRNTTSLIPTAREYYRVKKVLSDVLALEPMISGTVQTLENSDLFCNIKIIESGKKNLLNSKIAKIVKDDEAYQFNSPIFDAESYNSFLVDELIPNIPNRDGINSITTSINNSLTSIFSNVLNSSYSPYKYTYDSTYSTNTDYSGAFEISPSTGVYSEPISIIGYPTSTNIKYYNLNGDVADLSAPNLSIENMKFKVGGNVNYSKYCQEEYLNIAFDLCWERIPEETLTYTGEQKHIFSDELNHIINSSWHLELSDILKDFGLYNQVNHQDGPTHYSYISQKLTIEEPISQELWGTISDKIGVSNINSGYYNLFGNYGEYLEILNKGEIYIISYQETEFSPKQIYFAYFKLKNVQEVTGVTSSKETKFGFVRNIANVNFDFYTVIPSSITGYNHIPDTEYFNRFIIEEDGNFENTYVESGNSDIELFDLIMNSNNYPVTNDILKFSINASGGSGTKLLLKYLISGSTSGSYEFSSTNILPITLPADKCCRTYLATFRREGYRPPLGSDLGIGTSPFIYSTNNQDILLNLKSFEYKNGQIANKAFSNSFQCITGTSPFLDTNIISYYGITPLEAGEFCIRFAPNEDLVYKLNNVYAATVADYKDEWETDKVTTFFDTNEKYSNGEKGRWMSHKSYVYKNPIENATAFTGITNNTLDNKGLLKHYNNSNDYINKEYEKFVLFNWKLPEVNDELRWISQSEITSVNNLNQPEQEESIIGLNSSVIYSESDLKPILYANNANKNEIYFNSGVCDIPSSFLGTPIFGKPHSGNDLISLISSNNSLDIDVEIDIQKTYIIKYWLYHLDGVPIGQQPLTVSIFDKNSPSTGITGSFTITDNATNPIRVGNWDLITHEIIPNSPVTNELLITLTANGLGNYVDDLLFIPIDATSKCISYNCENDRVEAEFDSEHFATFFDYDYEGRLIRKRKETYRGVKNIAETFYNTPKVNVNSTNSGNGFIAPKKIYDMDTYKRNSNKLNNEIRINSGSSEEGTGSKFDIYDLKIDQEGINSKLFDTDTEELKENIDSLRMKLKDVKLDSLKKELDLESLDNINNYKNKFNQKYNELDSLQMPSIQLDTNGIESKLKETIESEAIKNGNHNTKIRKGK
jgi:hypothetical protein